MGITYETKIQCDFCGKKDEEVKAVVVGINKSCICDQCVEVAAKFLSEDDKEKGGS
ncbi:ClpX C4-type zinc finger protein [Fictibacillus aquaticus]|uniref:ClpX-type ZB domain-containing protein n=1 Tax=Fictibacillus aquaticus TaxID=2021314 RepID=A0A235FB45_9BACL|nr:ClpX C4-type zinc finger protein [Fictibacillus aquaticus]OYD58462.1 hypothetical protein CGZ90_00745 [Fictibacillus aquaticus]